MHCDDNYSGNHQAALEASGPHHASCYLQAPSAARVHLLEQPIHAPHPCFVASHAVHLAQRADCKAACIWPQVCRHCCCCCLAGCPWPCSTTRLQLVLNRVGLLAKHLDSRQKCSAGRWRHQCGNYTRMQSAEQACSELRQQRHERLRMAGTSSCCTRVDPLLMLFWVARVEQAKCAATQAANGLQLHLLLLARSRFSAPCAALIAAPTAAHPGCVDEVRCSIL